MRVRKNRIYPYPVLSVLSDNFLNNRFLSDIVLEYDSEIATVLVKTDIDDEAIIALLKQELIKLFLHIECSVTKYRSAFEIPYEKIKDYKIEIPLPYLKDSVEMMCLLVTQDEFSFEDDNLNEFYKNDVVIYPKNATIGYTETEEVNIIKTIDINGEIPSIFQISLDEQSKETSYECTSTYIVVYLPKEAHEQYYDLRGDFIRTKQLATNVNILTEIIDKIKSGANYSDCGWYVVLDERLKAIGYLDGFESDDIKADKIQSVSLAEKILNYPISESFGELLESKERRE